MTHITLATSGEDLEARFTQATGTAHAIVPLPTLEEVNEFHDWYASTLPDVLVLDARHDPVLSLELATDLTAQHVHRQVLLIVDQPEAISLPAMRAGVSDLIPANAEPGEIQQRLSHAVQRVQSVATEELPIIGQRPTGRVISSVSAAGGVGKTLLATNLAVALAQAQPHSTVLVDLDLQFGDVATTLGLDPKYRVDDVLPNVAHGDTIALKSRLTLHESGLLVLPAPDNPATADTISTTHISQLLNTLLAEFAFVVIDTATGLSDATLVALDHTTDPLLLTTLSVPSIHGIRKVLDTLSLLQMFSDATQVVVNLADTKDGVTPQDVAQTLGTADITRLPTSRRALGSINTGIPLAHSRPRDPFVKALRPIVDSLIADEMDIVETDTHRARKKDFRS
ncbi:AAA family ATPase [Enteractinococcus coprophilus]|uniref:Pilus assembly protein CpaE n=1 Tax=Enteractinococcus coprophilus TaxID=1027633 RepID=A0A543AGF4_9MICC|nr:AAA family ATPase [Enteractinococcus coprophilus]TQL71652.1 pilus assembly protein CpaE [Enteractinococcus coprophilus]